MTDGEVSSYLADERRSGDLVEVRGAVGGWFVWKPEDRAPVLLVAGGSGVVPLMAMIRSRRSQPHTVSARLLRTRSRRSDLRSRTSAARDRRRWARGLFLYTRTVPDGETRSVGRITAEDLVAYGWPADVEPTCYVCGPTAFVETVSDLLVGLGHDPAMIRTERFGPSGP